MPGGNKGAFTVNAGINNEDQLSESESVLANMKTRALDNHRWNLEINLQTEDDGKFSAEVDSATEFDIHSGVSKAGLTALIKNDKTRLKMSDLTILRTISSARSAGCTHSVPDLNLPTFIGSYIERM